MMNALILADGEVSARADLDRAWPGWELDLGLVVAADGGARHAEPMGVTIDVWVGDGDSLAPVAMEALLASGVPMETADRHKDESDTELAVLAALRRGAHGIVIVGALGGERIDHALANIGLLAHGSLAGHPAALIDARSRITLVRAPDPGGAPVRHPLVGRIDDLVSLLPMSPDVVGVTTSGLAYPLADEPLPLGPARGLSNVRTVGEAVVVVRSGLLLVIESAATLGS